MGNYRSNRLIFQPLVSMWFLAFAGICLIIESLERLNIIIPYVHYWLNDLIALPVILSLTVFLKRFSGPDKNFRLSPFQIMVISGYVSLVFELLLPLYSSRYTADLTDVAFYVAGAWFYHKKMNVAQPGT